MTTRYGFYVDLSSCTGCKACQIACKDKNHLDAGLLWRRVVEVTGGAWARRGSVWIDNTITYFTSIACMHCERPICKEVCPARAITQRDDGIVLIDVDKCVGCRYCEWACPYGAPQFDATSGVMTKCDFCYDYIDQGKPPACVSACQMRVLRFGDIEELQAQYGGLDDVFPLPIRAFTEPSLVLTPHRHAIPANSGCVRVGNQEEI